MAKIAFYSRVKLIRRLDKRVYLGGSGETAQFGADDMGYFVLLEGSHEAIHVGFEKPEFRIGDRIKVTMETVNG